MIPDFEGARFDAYRIKGSGFRVSGFRVWQLSLRLSVPHLHCRRCGNLVGTYLILSIWKFSRLLSPLVVSQT